MPRAHARHPSTPSQSRRRAACGSGSSMHRLRTSGIASPWKSEPPVTTSAVLPRQPQPHLALRVRVAAVERLDALEPVARWRRYDVGRRAPGCAACAGGPATCGPPRRAPARAPPTASCARTPRPPARCRAGSARTPRACCGPPSPRPAPAPRPGAPACARPSRAGSASASRWIPSVGQAIDDRPQPRCAVGPEHPDQPLLERPEPRPVLDPVHQQVDRPPSCLQLSSSPAAPSRPAAPPRVAS
jgi:hypothetical protein